ncbi:MAG: lysophospholipid acyltransferase family protein [Deltaproteobacteria bacterium]|nr:lysophospholipid acyltransferase family protein [Deltaproteobacteria bacterium]MBW2170592.1 lysophospholipid acyltransferase family protein [Deltaproteobacteria bacterium]MBW2260016.1 lysophospholipid acyltransferase family protein [Deltaproteobacteria bacterium]
MKASLKKKMLDFQWPLFGLFGKFVIDLIFSTVRIESIDLEKARQEMESGRCVFAFWHSRMLMVSYAYEGQGAAILVSRSNDGEMMAQVLERQGHNPVRGSTSRSGVRALSRMIKAVKEKNCPAAIVPDGPRGPRFKVQPGIIALAQKTGYPIVPISCSARRMKVFPSWDRFILPYPFNEGRVIYGAPISVPSELDSRSRELYRVKLENELNRITKAVDGYYGHNIN